MQIQKAKNMRAILLIILLCIMQNYTIALNVINHTQSNNNQIKTIDRIVAFVNKGIITSNEVAKEIRLLENIYKYPSNTKDKNFYDNIINQLILQKIQLDLALKYNITASDDEVNNIISNLLATKHSNLQALKNELTANSLDYNFYKTQIANQIIVEKLKQREVDAKIIINDDEVLRVFNSNIYKNKIDYNLSYIMLSISDTKDAKDLSNKKNLALKIMNELSSGADFKQMAMRYSNATNAINGGNIGWKSNISLPSPIISELNDIKVGQFTNIITLPIGLFIFKINDIKTANTKQIIKQYHVRHILIKVNENNSSDEAHKKILTVRAMLMNNDNLIIQEKQFINLAKKYSDDTSSINGGDLGWISNGATVPEFEKMIIATPLYQISPVFQTPFGWHILQIEEIRNSDQTIDREKLIIKNELRNAKSLILYNQWLNNIKFSAYIKITS